MANRRTENATSNKPGASGDPKGRPPGIKEAQPRRGYVKAALDRVLAKEPQLLDQAIRRVLADERRAHTWADLIGKVVIGQGSSQRVVSDILVGALQDVAKTDPAGLQRALLGALRGRDGFEMLGLLGRLAGGVVNITFGPPPRRSLGGANAARSKAGR